MNLGQQEKDELIYLLKFNGMTQKQLAEVLMCPSQSVSRSLGKGTLSKKILCFGKKGFNKNIR